MVSPLNVLDIPTYIEGFVKTCQSVKDCYELDATHKALMERAIQNSNRLNDLVSFIEDSNCYSATTWEYIKQLTTRAKLAMDRTLAVANILDAGTTKEDEAKVEITSSMDALEHWLNDLNLAILTSDRLSIKTKGAYGALDNIEFVIRAKKRISDGIAVDFVDSEILEPSTLADIDPEAKTGIYRVHSGPYSGCIVDPRDVLSYAMRRKGELAWDETKNIARLFAEDTNASESQLSSSVGILPCCGYTELENNLHGILFRIPPALGHPRTLRSILLEGDVKHSLHDRVQFATRLATSVLVVHSLGTVHKNIKPDAILVAESIAGRPERLYPYGLGTPFLLSFDSSRSSRGPTMKGLYPYPGGANWETIYIHPRHFGWWKYKYEMRDDVFGLGVSLLEIALWKSLFRWNPTSGKYEDNTDVIDLSPDRMRREAKLQGKPTNVDMSWLQQYLLIEAAEELVPPIMGDLFKDVIVGCLTFGDSGRISKSDVFITRVEDSSNIPPDDQSLCFVREILTKLNSIKS